MCVISCLGCSSYVELVTGINFALLSWSALQEKLKFFRDQYEKCAHAAFVAPESSFSTPEEAQEFKQRMLSSAAIGARLRVFELVWKTFWIAFLFTTMYGVISLYFDWYHPANICMVIPFFLYLGVSKLLLEFHKKQIQKAVVNRPPPDLSALESQLGLQSRNPEDL